MKLRDNIINLLLSLSAILAFLLIAGVLYTLFAKSLPIFRETGVFNFLTTSNWTSTQGAENVGIFGFVAGTLMTAVLALLICLPFSVAISLLCGDIGRGSKLTRRISGFFQTMMYIPSILLGVWGYYSLRPILAWLNIGEQGFSIFTASLVLALMIIPSATTICISFFNRIPASLKECAQSFGATQFDIARKVTFPIVRKGFVYAHLFAFSKVVGETMIVIMLIGNTFKVPQGIFDTGSTMTSVVLAQFGDSYGLKESALFAILLLLFLFTGVINYFMGNIMRKELS